MRLEERTEGCQRELRSLTGTTTEDAKFSMKSSFHDNCTKSIRQVSFAVSSLPCSWWMKRRDLITDLRTLTGSGTPYYKYLDIWPRKNRNFTPTFPHIRIESFNIHDLVRLPPASCSTSAPSASLDSKLASSGVTLDILLEKLAPLFCNDEPKGKYGIWLLHHHFDLEQGERMVKKGSISEPTIDQSSNIVAERWSGGGDELEHVYAHNSNDIPLPPSPEFLKQFQEIISAYNIDCLGICASPSQDEVELMKAGYAFLETCNPGRKQILTALPVGDPSLDDASVYRAAWSVSDSWRLNCAHFCGVNNGC
ncbi:hypothetical protein CVT26_006102 [Gymnopilus dilepis]|uniref:Uncharacterized protein n=1 Tax=Gymnopilus dilepis TaxID=231916 RepID=A0A409YKI7_9AGAR|nr:hypothetical protein CVT26_006102 [Gymnopilus dilepis]